MIFPAVDSPKIFDFIDEVRSALINNALVPFRDFGDIENYLKQQWAAMMYSFLVNKSESQRVADTLSTLAEMNNRIEMISKQILISVGTDEAKLTTELYEEIMGNESIRMLFEIGAKPTPIDILGNSSYNFCAESLGIHASIEKDHIYLAYKNHHITLGEADEYKKDYHQLRSKLINILEKYDTTIESYILKNPKSAKDLPI